MKNIRIFYLKIFIFFLLVKFSVILNRRVFVMISRLNAAVILITILVIIMVEIS